MDRGGMDSGFSANIFDRGGRSTRFWDDRKRGITTTSSTDGIFFAFCFEYVISFII
jgi:hypothetical protein